MKCSAHSWCHGKLQRLCNQNALPLSIKPCSCPALTHDLSLHVFAPHVSYAPPSLLQVTMGVRKFHLHPQMVVLRNHILHFQMRQHDNHHGGFAG